MKIYLRAIFKAPAAAVVQNTAQTAEKDLVQE